MAINVLPANQIKTVDRFDEDGDQHSDDCVNHDSEP